MSPERLTIAEIQSVVKKMSQSGLGEIEVNSHHWAIKIKGCPTRVLRTEVQEPAPVTGHCQPNELPPISVKAKMHGHFLLQHPGNKTDFIHVGAYVTKDQLIGLLKIGPVYLPVHSPCDGYVASIHMEEGRLVGFDSELITINQ